MKAIIFSCLENVLSRFLCLFCIWKFFFLSNRCFSGLKKHFCTPHLESFSQNTYLALPNSEYAIDLSTDAHRLELLFRFDICVYFLSKMFEENWSL